MSSISTSPEITVDIEYGTTVVHASQQDAVSREQQTSAIMETNALHSEDENLPVPEKDVLAADQQISAVPDEDAVDSDHLISTSQARSFPSCDPPPGVYYYYGSEECADLFRAGLNGDWERVLHIASKDSAWLRTGITKGGETVLHIAAAAKHLRLVKRVIEMDPSSLIFTNKDGSTPFCFAAVSGVVEIADIMLQHNSDLPNIRGRQGMTPLHMAVLLGHRAMVRYLLQVTDDEKLTDQDRIEILISSIDTDLFDVALDILKSNLGLALCQDAKRETALHALARKPLKMVTYQPSIRRIFSGSFATQEGKEPKAALELTQILWNEVRQHKKEVISTLIRNPWRLLFVAARLGKVEFLTVLIQSYPDLIWKVDENRYSIFHIAVIHRQVEVFKLIYEIGAIKTLIATYKDESGNNMLHLASKLAPPNRLSCVSGAALQMQRQLQWFEAVKQIVRPEYTEAENENKETPQDLFSKEHEALRKQGEDWMKKTAESCALVAALIATMVFSAAFQLPGGLNNDTGSPVLVKKTAFVFFTMSNAVSLFTSTASILMFLSILTSRYAERDFLESLPLKLMIGLILLLISIATMVLGFTVTFFIIFQEGLRWPPITIAILATFPVTLFALQQFPILAEMYYSTYKSRNMFLPGTRRLFQVPFSKTSALNWRTTDTSLSPTKESHVDDILRRYLPTHRRLTDADIVVAHASANSKPEVAWSNEPQTHENCARGAFTSSP